MGKTLVLGASLQSNRYSNLAIHKLLQTNEAVVGVGRVEGVVNNVTVQNNFEGINNIDTVTVYLNPEVQKKYYKSIVQLNPKRVIFNPGTENIEFEEILSNHNISFERACTLVLLSTNQY